MTQTELDQLRPGAVLKISKPKSPAAATQRTKIESIYTPCPGVRVAHCTYYQLIGNKIYPNRGEGNDCELNINLFGGEEVVPESQLWLGEKNITCQAMDSSLPNGICTHVAEGTHTGIDGEVRYLCAHHLYRMSI